MESNDAKRMLDALARKLGGKFMARANNSRMYVLKIAYSRKTRRNSPFRPEHKPRKILYTSSSSANSFGCVFCKSSKWARLAEALVGRTIRCPDGTELAVGSLEQLAVDLEVGGWL